MSETSQKSVDEYSILSAIWILACNEEVSFLLYSSAKLRLNLPGSFPLEELVEKHGELFKQNCPSYDLEIWKSEMYKGKNLPIEIKEIKDEKDKRLKITSLVPDDVFSSQFRVRFDSPPSDVRIFEWGLVHIEKLSAIKPKHNDNLNLFKEWIIPISSTLIALAALISSYWIQTASISSQEVLKKYELDSQEKLKKYEVSFSQRSDSYVSIMKSFELITQSVENRNKVNFQTNLGHLESSYYKIRPFLRVEAQARLSRTLKDFNKYMNDLNNRELSKDFTIKEQITYKDFKNYFEEILYKDLFEKSDYVNTPVTSPRK